MEILEDRRVLASAWRNPVNALDVSGDGNTVPLDVLSIINEINANGSRRLADVRDPAKPFWDANGDQNLAPLDALAVINGINAGYVSPFQLRETAGRLSQEAPVTITLGQTTGSRTYRLQVDATFDTSGDAAIQDVFAVYLVEPGNSSQTLLDQGTPGTALFTLAGGKAEFTPGQVRWDGTVLEIDLSRLSTRDTGVLKLQLLNNDSDSGTRVTVKPLSNTLDPSGEEAPILPVNKAMAAAGSATELAALSSTNDVEVQIENVRFDSANGRLAAELRLRNGGSSLGRTAVVSFADLPAGVTLRNPSGTTNSGVPYVNLRPAIPHGGLKGGTTSQPVLVEFDNPAQISFPLRPQILAAQNRPPSLAPIGPLTVRPGGVLTVPLQATDPDGDVVTFEINAAGDLPRGTLRGDGTLVFRPAPEHIGAYQFAVVANDGAAKATRSVTLHVVADPVTTTRISGSVLQTDGQPLANVPIEVGAVQGLTAADGSFVLDLGSGPLVSETIKIRGERLSGTTAFPFIAEKLHLLLEHEVFPGVNNLIDRPIYLPALDLANGKQIDPTQDTTVTSAALPGVSVLVRQNTLMTQQSTPFTGVLSITEVPPELTPAALPANLVPDLVVTIQPGEMVFAAPAPVTFPNRAGWPAGTLMNLWSINPTTGEFDDVGDMMVSADGSVIETISGGIVSSSWHFPEPEPSAGSPGSPGGAPGTPRGGCGGSPQGCGLSSTVETHSGAVIETHPLVTYQSQGVARGVQLVYDSLRADPRPIVHFTYRSVAPDPDNRLVARLTVSRGNFDTVMPGYVPSTGADLGLLGGEHFWSLPPNGGSLDAALQADLTSQPTGKYDYELTSGIRRFAENALVGASTSFDGSLIHVNTISSPIGAGWGIAGVQELVENPDGSILLVDGDGSELIFESQGGATFIAPPGDFSILEKLGSGGYRRTLPDQLVFTFNTTGQLELVRDRNGNTTRYQYDTSGRLEKIIDPAGLATTFAYGANGKLSSITDPAQRVTRLVHDAAGNLTRIIDPDDTFRTWGYDADHHLISEVDKRGFREETSYDFAGRASGSLRKDGSAIKVAPVQVQGLFPNTTDPVNAPVALNLIASQMSYMQANGQVTTSNLDQLGQQLDGRDGLGRLPSSAYDDRTLKTSNTDVRGNVTLYSYDARGNLVSIRDSLSGSGGVTGQVAKVGEKDVYIFPGTAGQRLFFDGQDAPVGFSTGNVKVDFYGPDGNLLKRSFTALDFVLDPFLQSGDYRLEVSYNSQLGLPADETQQIVSYGFQLFDLALTPNLELDKDTNLRVPPRGAVVFQFPGRAGERLELTNPDFNSSVGIHLYTPYQGLTVLPESFAVSLLADDTYALVVLNSSEEEATTNVKLTIERDPTVAIAGLDLERSGTLAPQSEASFQFTASAGVPVSLARLGGASSVFPSLVDATGTTIGFSDGIVFLPRTGTYQVKVENTFDSPLDYHFRATNLASSAHALALDAPVNSTLPGFATDFYAFEGVAGQRVFIKHSNANLFRVEISAAGATHPLLHLGVNLPIQLPYTGRYFLQIRSGQESAASYTLELKDNSAEPELPFDTEITGTIQPGDPPQFFRFAGQTGQRFYFDDLGSTPAGSWVVIDPDGNPERTSADSGFGNSLGSDRGWALLKTGTYRLRITPPESGATPANYHFRFLESVTTSQPLQLGQVVSGSIDRPFDDDEYTFTGSVGQMLYFDGLGEVPNSLKIALVSPSGQYLYARHNIAFGPGPHNDVGPLTLLENGTYRLTVFGDWFGNAFTDSYAFRLLDVATLPAVGGGVSGVIQPGGEAPVFRLSGRAGQRFEFVLVPHEDDYRDSTWSLIGDQQVLRFTAAERLPNGSLKGVVVQLPSDRDYVLTSETVVNWPPEVAPRRVPYQLLVSDVSDPPVAVSGLSAIRSGSIAPGQSASFAFTAPAGLLVSFDNRIANQNGLEVVIIGPESNEPLRRFLIGSDDSPASLPPFRLPDPGNYTITVRGTNAAASGDYDFRLVDLLHDATPIAYGDTVTGTLEAGKLATHIYRFTADIGQPFYLDQIRLPEGWNFQIAGPDGKVLPSGSGRFFSGYIASATGTYYVFASGPSGDYSFQLLDMDTAAIPVEPGTLIEGVKDPGSRAVIYRYQATAGEPTLFNVFDSGGLLFVNNHMEAEELLAVTAQERTLKSTGRYWLIRDVDSAVLQANPTQYSLLVTEPTVNTSLLSLGNAGGPSQRTFAYDPVFGQLIRSTDELGRTTQIDIDPATGNTLKVTQLGGDDQASSIVTTFTYTSSGLVDTITDPLGHITDYEYDGAGRTVSITRAKGTPVETVKRMEYDAAGNLVAMIDANNHRTEYQYDSMNRQIRITHPDPDGAGPLLSPVFQYSYDAVGNPIAITDPLGHISRTTYDALDRMLTSSNEAEEVTRYEYDLAGNVTHVTDPLGRVSRQEYDARNRVTANIDPAGNTTRFEYDSENNLVARIDAEGRKTTYEYDARNRLVREIDALNHSVVYTYDANDRLIAQTDKNGHTTRWEYDAFGRVVKAVDALSNLTQFQYNLIGDVVHVTDPLDRTTRYQYDELDRVVLTTSPAHGTVTYEYDKVGNILSIADALGHKHQFVYDALNREIESREELQNRTSFSYDPLGRMTSLTDPLGHTVALTYDAVGRRTSSTDALNQVISWTYDDAGQLIRETDQSGAVTTNEYDLAGRLVRQSGPLNRTRSQTFDNVGNILTDTDGVGNTTRYEFDKLNRVIKLTDGLGNSSHYEYDPVGNVVSLIDTLGNETVYTYDALDRLVAEMSPSGKSRSTQYDAVGNRIEVTDRNDRTIRFSYDGGNRKLTEEWFGPAGQLVHSLAYAYDQTGKLVSASDANSTHHFTYDSANQLTKDEISSTLSRPSSVLSYDYDDAGSVTRMDVRFGNQDVAASTYARDPLGRVSRVSQDGASITAKSVDIKYTPLGYIQSTERFASADRTVPVASSLYSYDTVGRLTGLEHAAGTQSLASYDFSYDRADRLVEFTAPDGTSQYGYDKNGQLVSVTSETQPAETNIYDQGGNPSGNGVQIGPGNLLLSDATYEYRYDAEGNRVERTTKATGEKQLYRWDHRNRLVEVQSRNASGSTVAEVDYIYDALDHLIARIVDADGGGPATPQTEHLVYDRDQILLSMDDQGSVGHLYMYGSSVDQVFADEDATGDVAWLLPDHQGTVRDVIDSAGEVQEHRSYDAFGRMLTTAGAATRTRFAYTGRPWDAIADAYDFRARFYDPSSRRFMSEDPMGVSSGDYNSYRFLLNSPINAVDPTGASWSNLAHRGAEMTNMVAGAINDAAYDAASGAESFAAGFGDSVTFGATQWARGQLGTRSDYSGELGYTAGQVAGVAASFALGYGAGQGAGRAAQAAQYYVAASTAWGFWEGTRAVGRLAHGCGQWSDVGTAALSFLPLVGNLRAGVLTKGPVYSATEDIGKVWRSGRVWGRTEGSVYGIRMENAPRWRTMANRKTLDPGVLVFEGKAAELFRPHRIEGPYSLMKAALGQQKAGFGDITFDWTRDATRYMKDGVMHIKIHNAELVTHAAANQSRKQAMERLWGRRLGIESLAYGALLVTPEARYLYSDCKCKDSQ